MFSSHSSACPCPSDTQQFIFTKHRSITLPLLCYLQQVLTLSAKSEFLACAQTHRPYIVIVAVNGQFPAPCLEGPFLSPAHPLPILQGLSGSWQCYLLHLHPHFICACWRLSILHYDHRNMYVFQGLEEGKEEREIEVECFWNSYFLFLALSSFGSL